jgi:L-alanine-DL-glutamate epimerase-like enolase superfamily enzyme
VAGKIEKIELYHVDVPLPAALFPVWIPGYPQYRQSYTLLAVTTGDGLIGYASGPAFDRERETLGEYIGQFLLGIDPYDLEVVRERLRQASYLGWRNSWMDVAFWDLTAKVERVPLHQLIYERAFGKAADAGAPAAVPVYASFREMRAPMVRAEAIERAQRKGFTAAKISVHSNAESEDIEQLVKARAAAGPKFELSVHAHQAWTVSLVESVSRWDLDRARRFVHRAAELDYQFVQEPLHDEAWDELSQLTSEAVVPIAGGVLSVSFISLRAMIQQRCYALLTPDSAFAGLDNVVRTMRACHQRGLGFAPASNGDGLTLAVNAHALAAWKRRTGDRTSRLEYPWEPPAMIPEHRDAILTAPLYIQPDGSLPVPAQPGVGVEVDPQALKRHGSRFYHLTPVRFVVTSARRAGLRQTAEFMQRSQKRELASDESA